jgi:hypothetical protein
LTIFVEKPVWRSLSSILLENLGVVTIIVFMYSGWAGWRYKNVKMS